LHHLKTLWAEEAEKLPKVSLSTNLSPEHSCAIANFSIEGKDMTKLGRSFLQGHNIYTTVTHHKDVAGMRISPNVFTSEDEMHYLAKIIKKFAE
jgi:selenocysteine lyase/cysteine desulfurase